MREDPEESRVRANGVSLACFEWSRGAPGPTLLLAHATGFHARCWDPVLRRLGRRHAIAVDLRGHGRSERTPIRHWKVFGEDLAALVRARELGDLVGIGHSMGGHALVDAAAACPDRLRRLVLIDPVISPPDAYGSGGWRIASLRGEPHPTSKRKRHFDSPAQMLERFRDRPPYADFDPEALRAYCEHGLLPRADGRGFELACPPELEASIYMTSHTNAGVHRSVRALAIPVLVVRAKAPQPDRSVMDFSSSPTWPGLAKEFARGSELHLPERSHFLPMEDPGLVAQLILDELAASASGGSGGA